MSFSSVRIELAAGVYRRFREWWWYNLYHYPHTPDTNLRPEYDRLAWRHSASDLRAWQRGETGYPLVDAGMRELWVTGCMQPTPMRLSDGILSQRPIACQRHKRCSGAAKL